MIAYGYDKNTGEYLGPVDCQPDPLDGGFLLPACATEIEPPETGAGKIAKWDGNAWAVVKLDLNDGEAQAVAP